VERHSGDVYSVKKKAMRALCSLQHGLDADTAMSSDTLA
jgi:hypothetical protein